MEWQPIETAPLNPEGEASGPWVLIWDEYSHTILQARFSYDGEDRGWTAKNHDTNEKSRPTHWMALPDAPEPQKYEATLK
jgi:hypothetical protein